MPSSRAIMTEARERQAERWYWLALGAATIALARKET